MANELKLSVQMVFTKGTRTVSKRTGDLTFDVAGDKWTHLIQEIGLAEEALQLGDIAAGGYCFLHNLDATNFVSIRRATAEGNAIKIGPGEIALFRLEATAPFAIADTAACDVEIVLLEA